MTTTIAAIRAKIDALLAEQVRVETEVNQHCKRAEAAKATLRVVEGKLAVLRELAEELDEPAPNEVAPVTTAVIDDVPIHRLGPADAVRELLRRSPGGMTQHMVVNMLFNTIDSDSNDKKRLLYNTIFNLKKRGMVREAQVDGRARLFLNDNQELTKEDI